MFRLINIINVSLGVIALGLVLTVIVVKSTIANEVQRTRALTVNLDSAYARQDALQAEWARLQHRSNILALGQILFDDGVQEIAEEVDPNDIPLRVAGADGAQAALDLFMRDTGGNTISGLTIVDETKSDFIAQLIAQDLEN